MSSSRDSKLGLDLSCSSQYSRVSVAAAVVDVVLELLVMIAAVLRGQVLAAECLSMVATMLHRRQIEGGKKKLSTPLFSELSMNSPPRGGVHTRWSGGVVNVQTRVGGLPAARRIRHLYPVQEQGMKPWCRRFRKMQVWWHRNRHNFFMR